MSVEAKQVMLKKLENELHTVHTELHADNELNLSSVKTRMGKTTIEIENISKRIKDKVLFFLNICKLTVFPWNLRLLISLIKSLKLTSTRSSQVPSMNATLPTLFIKYMRRLTR